MSPDEEPVRVPITDVFDLHTVRPKEAGAVVEAYLEEAHRLGLKAVRIIHGRGIGVQREMVRAVLARSHFVRVLWRCSAGSRRLGRDGGDTSVEGGERGQEGFRI